MTAVQREVDGWSRRLADIADRDRGSHKLVGKQFICLLEFGMAYDRQAWPTERPKQAAAAKPQASIMRMDDRLSAVMMFAPTFGAGSVRRGNMTRSVALASARQLALPTRPYHDETELPVHKLRVGGNDCFLRTADNKDRPPHCDCFPIINHFCEV